MAHAVAVSVSLRSRERKLRLFLELFRPGPETTVLDVGVTDAPFGDGSTDNFFEARYPWPERITAVGTTGLDRFAAAFPAVRGRARRRAGAALRRRRVRARLLERRRSSTSPADEPGQRQFVAELCRVARRVFVTTPNRSSRSTRTRCCRSCTGCPQGRRASACCGRAASTTCSTRSAPRELAALFPYPVRIVNRGVTLVAVGPR